MYFKNGKTQKLTFPENGEFILMKHCKFGFLLTLVKTVKHWNNIDMGNDAFSSIVNKQNEKLSRFIDNVQ